MFDGWTHEPKDCPCCNGEDEWHRYVSDNDLQAGIQGRLGLIIYPLMNVWQNFVDKNTA